MNKQISFVDSNDIKESSHITATHDKTNIIIKCHETGEVLWRGHNKIILPGAGFTARAHFDIPNAEITPSYNTVLGLENSVYQNPESDNKVFLFCVGTDGCGAENSQVYEENYAKWINEEAIVPFRYPLVAKDINTSLKSTYFGRKIINDKYAAYYFKKFESNPVFKQQYTDGTPITSNIYNENSNLEVESYIELKLQITKEDCREFFIATTGINTARINTISLCTAWPKNFGSLVAYQDIRPLTKLNIPNEALIDLTKGIDIIYQIYY